jgi:hypothetical protein
MKASDIQDLLAEFGVQLESPRDYERLAARFTDTEGEAGSPISARGRTEKNLGPLAAAEMSDAQQPKN